MRCACVDIGSNTTRLLVAEVAGGVLTTVVAEKAYTDPEVVADTVAAQVAVARAAGALRLRVVATAGVRAAPALAARIEDRAAVAVDVLTGEQEAALAFAGATVGRPPAERVAVVDVGGGSTEIAVGTPGGGMRWCASVPHPDGVGRIAALAPPPAEVALVVGGSGVARALREPAAGARLETILAVVADLLGRPLEIGAGGLREGVCLSLAG